MWLFHYLKQLLFPFSCTRCETFYFFCFLVFSTCRFMVRRAALLYWVLLGPLLSWRSWLCHFVPYASSKISRWGRLISNRTPQWHRQHVYGCKSHVCIVVLTTNLLIRTFNMSTFLIIYAWHKRTWWISMLFQCIYSILCIRGIVI